MSKKHFEAIAECLRNARIAVDDMEMSKTKKAMIEYHVHVVYVLAIRLSDFNENFNFYKFIEAAGGKY